jgi:hypothetical protein
VQCPLILFFFFFQYWGLNSGPMLARQTVYHLSHTPTLFTSGIFPSIVLHFFVWQLDCDPPIYPSGVAGITDMHNHAQFIDWNRVLLTFCLGWPWTVVLLVSASVTKITGMNQSTWPPKVHINCTFLPAFFPWYWGLPDKANTPSPDILLYFNF